MVQAQVCPQCGCGQPECNTASQGLQNTPYSGVPTAPQGIQAPISQVPPQTAPPAVQIPSWSVPSPGVQNIPVPAVATPAQVVQNPISRVNDWTTAGVPPGYSVTTSENQGTVFIPEAVKQIGNNLNFLQAYKLNLKKHELNFLQA